MAVDTVTLAASPRAHPHEVGLLRKLFLSLVASVLGGLAALAVTVIGMPGEPSEWWRATRVMALIVGLHVGPGWLFAVAPLALNHSANSPLLRPGLATLFGAICGVAVLVIALAGFWRIPLHPEVRIFAAAGACGAVTWESFGFLLRRQSRTARKSRTAELAP